MWEWIAEWVGGILFSPPVLFAVLTGIGVGVITARLGYEDAAPYAATTGFVVHVGILIVRAIRRSNRRDLGRTPR